MIFKLLLIAIIAAIVFWGVGRVTSRIAPQTTSKPRTAPKPKVAPKPRTASKPHIGGWLKKRLLPLLLSPLALPILKRVFWLVLRLIMRR